MVLHPSALVANSRTTRHNVMQAVLDALEQPYYQLQEAQQDAKLQAHGPVWQGLQCATALRRLLHPCKLLPQQPDVRVCFCKRHVLTLLCSSLLSSDAALALHKAEKPLRAQVSQANVYACSIAMAVRLPIDTELSSRQTGRMHICRHSATSSLGQ